MWQEQNNVPWNFASNPSASSTHQKYTTIGADVNKQARIKTINISQSLLTVNWLLQRKRDVIRCQLRHLEIRVVVCEDLNELEFASNEISHDLKPMTFDLTCKSKKNERA